MNAFALGSALLMGFFGGVHCITMCGGIVGVLCASSPSAGKARFRYVLAYNMGRIATYTTLGMISGSLSALATKALPVQTTQLVLRVLAAILLIGAGLYLADESRVLGRLEAVGKPLWKLVEPWARRLGPIRSISHALLVGALWGFLPCGLVYAAVTTALVTGSFVRGGLTMLAFGLGTLPTLLAAGAVAEGLRELSRSRLVRRTAGLLIALSGCVHLAMAAIAVGAIPSSLFETKPPCCAVPHQGSSARDGL